MKGPKPLKEQMQTISILPGPLPRAQGTPQTALPNNGLVVVLLSHIITQSKVLYHIGKICFLDHILSHSKGILSIFTGRAEFTLIGGRDKEKVASQKNQQGSAEVSGSSVTWQEWCITEPGDSQRRRGPRNARSEWPEFPAEVASNFSQVGATYCPWEAREALH